MLENAIVPRYPLAVLAKASVALTVTLNGVPAVAVAGADTVRPVAMPGTTVTAGRPAIGTVSTVVKNV